MNKYIVEFLGTMLLVFTIFATGNWAAIGSALAVGVYETTNYALFSNWSIVSVIIDTLWGGLLFASTTFIVNKLRNIF